MSKILEVIDTYKENNSENLVKNICENIKLIDINFKKCIKGYHLINSSPVNETVWEDLNSIIFESLGIKVYSNSKGSHLSGMDIN